MDNTKYIPSVLSFCPGLRGLERGLERAVGRVKVIAYVEIEAFIAANLVTEMEEGALAPAPVWSNIKTFNAECVRGKFDWLLAGYPCQPFSNAGNRLGTEDPRHLYPYIYRTIETGRPMVCFFENVEGHLSLGYDTVYKSLRALGYRVESGIYSAEEVGAPHQRNRLFILAIREDVLEHTSNSDVGNVCRRFREIFKEYTQPSNSGCTLGNTSSERLQESGPSGQRQCGKENGEGMDDRLEQSSYELADPNGIGHLHGQPQQHTTEAREHAQCKLTTSSGHVANPDSSGSREDTQPAQLRSARAQQSSINSGFAPTSENNEGRLDRWPSRPGQQQYHWEAPRVEHTRIRMPAAIQKIWKRSRKGFEKMLGKEAVTAINQNLKTPTKSRVGCTIDGYNYREDLLRAYGNSVVEQTAEVAFIDLLNKHLENSKKQ